MLTAQHAAILGYDRVGSLRSRLPTQYAESFLLKRKLAGAGSPLVVVIARLFSSSSFCSAVIVYVERLFFTLTLRQEFTHHTCSTESRIIPG